MQRCNALKRAAVLSPPKKKFVFFLPSGLAPLFFSVEHDKHNREWIPPCLMTNAVRVFSLYFGQLEMDFRVNPSGCAQL